MKHYRVVYGSLSKLFGYEYTNRAFAHIPMSKTDLE